MSKKKAPGYILDLDATQQFRKLFMELMISASKNVQDKIVQHMEGIEAWLLDTARNETYKALVSMQCEVSEKGLHHCNLTPQARVDLRMLFVDYMTFSTQDNKEKRIEVQGRIERTLADHIDWCIITAVAQTGPISKTKGRSGMRAI